MRLILRPGCHVLRRGDGRIQVGLDPTRRVLLPDTGPVRAALALLQHPADQLTEPDDSTSRLLADRGLLMGEASLTPLIPLTGARGERSRHGVAALAATAGDDTPRVLASRQACRVAVLPFGGPAGAPLVDGLAGLLTASGLSWLPAGQRGAPPTTAALVGVGEPRRELLDDWVRAGTPHVLVRLIEGDAVVGPFVVPGRTACLRCLDAHHTDVDPSWPLLVTQYAAASERDRPDGAPEPVDPALASVAVAWAARDLVSYAGGHRPSTWSATVRLDPGLTAVQSRTWLRHPACGCSWG